MSKRQAWSVLTLTAPWRTFQNAVSPPPPLYFVPTTEPGAVEVPAMCYSPFDLGSISCACSSKVGHREAHVQQKSRPDPSAVTAPK